MGLSWLIELLRLVFDLIPRPHIVSPDEKRVTFFLGRYPRVREPGWAIEWPLISRYETVHVAQDVLCGEITRAGHKQYWQASFRITDPLAATVNSVDPEAQTQTLICLYLYDQQADSISDEDIESLNRDIDWGITLDTLGYTSDGVITLDING